MNISTLLSTLRTTATTPFVQCSSMQDWFVQHQKATNNLDDSLVRALIAGATFDQVSFAFASAYQSALEHMFGLSRTTMGALCHNEKGVKKPREMQSSVNEYNGVLQLDAQKGFVSGGVDAQVLFVSAIDRRPVADGQIIIVQLDNTNNQYGLEALPALPFVPELSHAKFFQQGAVISETQVLSGDGYSDYVKPFRTEEDLHILAALLGQRLRLAMEDDPPFVTQFIALAQSLIGLQNEDRNAPALHLCLAGLKRTMLNVFEEHDKTLKHSCPKYYSAWLRDKQLLSIAAQAQDMRTQRAWAAVFAS